MTAPGFEALPGTALPGGRFVIAEEDEALLGQVLGVDASEGHGAHPLWAYIATQRGIGIGVAEICRLADFDVNEGPMLGSSHLSYLGPIEIGVSYRVSGEVVSIERKHGRSGTFDVLEFREDLRDERDNLVAVSTSTYILPRRAL